MGLIITNANIKGGIGKTTGNSAFAEILAECGNKVLIVDNDPQCNISALYNMLSDRPMHTVFDLYAHWCTAEETVQKTRYKNIDMIVSRPELKDNLLGTDERNHSNWRILKEALMPLKEKYDYIIIDKGPATDLLGKNVFTAADEVIAPVLADAYSYQGIGSLQLEMRSVRIQKDLNPDLRFRGIYMTNINRQSAIYKVMREEDYGRTLSRIYLGCDIRQCSKVSESTYFHKPLLHYSRRSTAAADYIYLLLKLGYITEEQAEKELKKHDPDVHPLLEKQTFESHIVSEEDQSCH